MENTTIKLRGEMVTQATTGLTDQIRYSVNNPLTTTDLEFPTVLDDVLGAVGLSVKDAGGEVRFYGGADPLITSAFRFASAAAVALADKGDAAYAVRRDRGGDAEGPAL